MNVKNISINILLLIASLLFTFVLSEIALRIVGKNIVPIGLPSRELGYVNRSIDTTRYSPESGKEVFISINDYGFRDSEWEVNENEFRIMILGDSFILAKQVANEERFSTLLEQKFDESGQPTRVYPLGRSGSGPETHLLYLKKYYDLLKPDVVIATFFNGNDYIDMSFETSPRSGRVTYEVIDGEVIRHSERATLREKIEWETRLQLGKLYVVQLARRAKIRLQSVGKENVEEGPREAPLYCNTQSETTKDAYLIAEHILVEMKKIAGDSLVIMQLPNVEQVEEAEMLRTLENCDPWQPEQILSSYATKHEVTLLQLLPRMQDADESLYWGHLNYAGHRFVANALYEFLTEPKTDEPVLNDSAFRFIE